MRQLALVLICLVSAALYVRGQKPLPQAAARAPVAAAWTTYRAPDGSFEVELPGVPGLVTARHGDEEENFLLQANSPQRGEAIKVGWRRPSESIADYRHCRVLEQRALSVSGLAGVEYRLQGDARWSARTDGVHEEFEDHRLLLVPAGGRCYFVLVASADFSKLDADFARIVRSLRITSAAGHSSRSSRRP